MIELRNLSTGYGKRVVARALNATLREGELTCLLGSNGVGKSTLLRTMSAFQPALSGEVLIDGTPLRSLTSGALSRLVGVVLTERPDIQHITVREMVGMGRSPYTGFWGKLDDEDERQVDESIRLTGILPLQHRYFNTLSDGERQKVMIAKTLAQQTPIILLDEPTAFLDFPSKVEIMRLLAQLAKETHKSVLMSTHDVEMALRLSDNIWLMSTSGIQTGTFDELYEVGEISRFFEGDGLRYDKERDAFCF